MQRCYLTKFRQTLYIVYAMYYSGYTLPNNIVYISVYYIALNAFACYLNILFSAYGMT